MKSMVFHPYTNCDLCGSDDYKILYKKVEIPTDLSMTDRFSAAESVYNTDPIVQCNSCGLVYTNPRISTDILTNAYIDGMQKVYLAQTKSKIITLLENIEWMESFYPIESPEHGLRVLDVGTGSGLFLQIAEQNGWEAVGVEPNHWLADYGRTKLHLNIYNDILDNVELPDNFYDSVTLWDVLEHFPSPVQALKKINSTLRPGGYVFIVTPNFDCLYSKILRKRWWFVMAHHLFYLTPSTITKMLEISNFQISDKSRHYGTWDSRYIGHMIQSLNRSTPNDLFVRGLSLLTKCLRLKRLSMYAGQMKVAARKM